MQVGRDETVLRGEPEPWPELVISKLGKPLAYPYLAIRRGQEVEPIARLMVPEAAFWASLATALQLTINLPDGSIYVPAQPERTTTQMLHDLIEVDSLERAIERERAKMQKVHLGGSA